MAQEARAGWQAARRDPVLACRREDGAGGRGCEGGLGEAPRRDAVSRSGLGSRREDVGVMAQEANTTGKTLCKCREP